MNAGPRLLFVTGPGGDGTTTVAAATAAAAARGGRGVLLLSAEPPARLTALLGAAPPVWPAEPAEGPGGCRAARVDTGRWYREAVLALQERARPALDAVAAHPLHDDELGEPPGVAPLALLAAARAASADAAWDLVVVDAPPVTETIRLLALPGGFRRHLGRLLPRERLAARALRPVLAQLGGLPLPAAGALAAGRDWEDSLAALQELVAAPSTAVRLVYEPGGRSVAALRTARAGLALHGLPLEAVVANRLLPEGGGGPLPAALAARQRQAMAEAALVPGLAGPHQVPHLGREPGPGDLAGPAAALAVPPPASAAARDEPELRDLLAADGILVWRLPVPGAAREELDLVRRGGELLVTAGPFHRALPLPAVLRRCTVTGAALADDGHLAVRFAPDPALWPRETRPFG